MNTPTLDTTTDRLERLERECEGLKRQARRWKRGGAVVAIGAVALLMTGARGDEHPKELEVGRLIIRGDDGKVYAELGVVKNQGSQRHSPSLIFRDQEGKTRSHFGLAELLFTDKDERQRLRVDQARDGSMSLSFNDESGTPELTIGNALDGAGLHLFGPGAKGRGGRDHGGLFVKKDGSTLLHLFRPGRLDGKDTHERIAFGVQPDGTTYFNLRGAVFDGGVGASVRPDGALKLSVDGLPLRFMKGPPGPIDAPPVP